MSEGENKKGAGQVLQGLMSYWKTWGFAPWEMGDPEGRGQDLTQIPTGALWLPWEDRQRWGEGTRAEGEPRRESDPGHQCQACSHATSVGAPSVSPALADYLYLFIWPCSMWDLSSPTEDQTHAPCTESVES